MSSLLMSMCRQRTDRWTHWQENKRMQMKSLSGREYVHRQNQIKQEAHSVKQVNAMNKDNRWGWFRSLTFSGKQRFDAEGCTIAHCYRTSNKWGCELWRLMSEPRPAPLCLGAWLMGVSAAAIIPLHHPSLLDGPLISGQREGRASIDTCLPDGVIMEFRRERFARLGGIILPLKRSLYTSRQMNVG